MSRRRNRASRTRSEQALTMMPTLSCHNCDDEGKNSLPDIRIQKFSGDPELLDFFVSQLQEISKLKKWPDEYTLAVAKSKLDGNAFKLITQPQVLSKISKTDDLFQTLRSFFVKKSLAASMAEYENLNLLPGESIRNLANRLDLLAATIFPNITSDEALDQFKYVKFVQIIPGDIRLVILQGGIKEYRAAVQKAILVQECQVNNNILQASSSNVVSLEEQIHNINETLSSISKASEKQGENSQRSHFRHGRPHMRPPFRQNFRPKRHFHNVKSQNFRNHRRNFRGSTPPRGHNTQTSSSYNIVCQLCLAVGHSARECTLNRQCCQQNCSNSRTISAPPVSLPHNYNFNANSQNHPNES